MRRVDFGNVAVELLVRLIARIFYITGLSLFFPFLYIRSTEGFVEAQTYFYVSLGLVIIGLVMLYQRNRSASKTFSAAGLMTLIPGVFAAIFNFYGPEIINGYGRLFIQGYDAIGPRLVSILQEVLPQFWSLTIFYIVIGIIMLYVAFKLRVHRF